MSPARNSGASVTHLHPEHLLDKLDDGGLSPAERRQLESHTAACSACRFELLVRGDLAVESLKHSRGRDVCLGVGADA
ncbi:MAG TPA: zf-HC2 domain-containing protein [Polyangiaceae bacterium]